MSDEIVVDKVEADPIEVEVSPVETQAREQGWVSKEEWVESGRSEDEWRPAKEFVDRGELYKSIHQVKRELKQEKQAREALSKHHTYVFEMAYQKAKKDLQLERRAAVRNEDIDAVEAIEDEMSRLDEEHAQARQALVAQQAAAVQGPPPEFQAWVDRNTWYQADNELRIFADAYGNAMAQNRPGIQPAEVLKAVEQEVRKRFPEKFGTKRAAPNAVAPVNRTSRKSSNDVQLDEFEQEIMNTLVKSGEMTEAEYKSQIKKAKGL